MNAKFGFIFGTLISEEKKRKCKKVKPNPKATIGTMVSEKNF